MADHTPGRRQKEACWAGASARYFCTVGRGMQPFLLREIGARLGASEVECVLGKVFFTTSAELTKLKKLKSAERLFLLLDKSPPLPITRNKGKMIHDIHRLVSGNPRCWLDVVTAWQSLQMKPEHLCQKSPASNKRKLEDEKNIKHKKQKGELGETVPAENQRENQQTYEISEAHKENVLSQDTSFLETDTELIQEKSIEKNSGFTFRVSCRISGAIAKSFTSQDMGRIIGIAVMKSFGWKADLRNPDIEIFVHLNDIYTVIGIPVFRLPLASRTYIKTAGLRSTVAWAMASIAEIKAGDFVLDPTCGLGTVLLEAATEWPKAHYLGVDISDSQLQGAHSNIKSASLMDKVELLKASATVLPFSSESVDIVLADIPFGKKFKITKDTKLVPKILQELERVLCAEGIAVVLLSQELYKHFSNGIISGPERDSHITIEPANSCTKSAIVSIMSNIEENHSSSCSVSSLAQEGEKEHITGKRIGIGSLVLVESFKVSLGKTDAFICKYKKLTASPT